MVKGDNDAKASWIESLGVLLERAWKEYVKGLEKDGAQSVGDVGGCSSVQLKLDDTESTD